MAAQLGGWATSCAGKFRHRTRRSARLERVAKGKTAGGRLAIYKCAWCSGVQRRAVYHLGHRPQRTKAEGMVNERLTCLANDLATLRRWLMRDLKHLTEPQRMDYTEVLDGMERDIAALRSLALPPSVAPDVAGYVARLASDEGVPFAEGDTGDGETEGGTPGCFECQRTVYQGHTPSCPTLRKVAAVAPVSRDGDDVAVAAI